MSLSNAETTPSDNTVIFLTVTCANLLIPKYIPPFSVRKAILEPRTCRQLCLVAGFEPRRRFQLCQVNHWAGEKSGTIRRKKLDSVHNIL
jgi:hypothetical protein